MADQRTQVVITAKDDTAAGLASVAANVGKLGGSFTGLANPVSLAATAVTAATAAMAASITAAVNTGDQLNKLSQKTGIAVEKLSELAYAGDLADVNLESLATGIRKLSVNMAEAATNTNSKAAEAFKLLGVSVKDANGNLRSSDAVIEDLADRFAAIEDGAGKTALAVALFGKSGADLIPFLNQGGKGLRDLADEAKKLGLVMSGETAKAAEEFNDNLKKLSLSASALGRSIAADLLGPMAKYLALAVEAKKEGAGLFGGLAIAARGGPDGKTLDEMRQRAGSLQGTISFLTQGGQEPNDPVFGTKLRNSRAELAILQRQISERMKEAENFGPPVAPTAKLAAPVGADEESTKARAAEAKRLAAEKKRFEELGQRNLAASIDSEEEMQKVADKRAMASQQAAQREAESTERRRQQYINLADPLNKYRAQLDEINKLRAEGKLTADQAIEAEWQVNEAMDKTKDSLYGVKEVGLDTYAELAQAVRGWGNQFTDTLADMVTTGKADFSSLANSIIRDLARIQIQKNITTPLLNFGTSALDKAFGSLGSGGGGDGGFDWMPSSAPSFSGGGFTGSGSRSGGVDGEGGFMAVLHPNETVIDHAAGNRSGSGGVTVVQNLNFAVGVAQTVRAEVMNLMPQIQAAAQSAVFDARLRGGSARMAFKG